MRAQIRRANVADYEALAAVFDEAERFHREGLPEVFRVPPERFPPASLFEEWVQQEGSDVFVADEDGDLVGFITARAGQTPDDSLLRARPHAVGDMLAVRAARRRHGTP